MADRDLPEQSGDERGGPMGAPVEQDTATIDLGSDESRRLAAFWKKQCEDYDKEWKRWHRRGRDIEKRYRDERPRPAMDDDGTKRYNALWANVEILQPALYGRPPVPIAERRFKDKDPVGRGAAQILERALRNELEFCGLDDAVQQAVKDYLLPGRGVVWVRYEPEFEEGPSIPVDTDIELSDSRGEIYEDEESPEQEDSEQKLRNTDVRIIRESTPVDYIPWEDFRCMPARARVWREVNAVSKTVYMTRKQMKDRFGDQIGRAIPFQKQDRERRRPDVNTMYSDDADQVGEITEIWFKSERMVYWIAEGYEFLCDAREDPLGLSEFFPVPRPLFANATNGTLVPVADYIQYQSQAIQLDELTQRIAMIVKGCKWAGLYDASNKDLMRLFDESVENELVPVDNWAAFAEKGGVANAISLLPLKEVIGIINELTAAKEKQLQEMNQLTGITDVMRGTSDARETMGGQRLKTNNSMTRIQRRQAEVARFSRDAIRIMAEIMSMHFSPQSLIEASGALYEEGLGPDDMPPLSAMQQPGAPQLAPPQARPPGLPQIAPPAGTPPGPAGAAPAGGSPVPPSPGPPAGLPPTPGMVPGAPPPPAPPMPGGANVVPFRPPGGPGAPPGQGGPPPGQGGPPPGQGGPPPGPPPPPAVAGAPGAPGGPPAPPPVPPELIEKLQALQRIAQSLQLLRNEKLRGFRVDIEVDSTVAGDIQQEKADRTEFLTMVTKFMKEAMMISAQVPEVAPLLGKFLQFGVRGFRVGRDLETAIEEFCDEAEGIAKQAAQRAAQANDSSEADKIKAQADMLKAHGAVQVAQIRAQSDRESAQSDAQLAQFQMHAESQSAAAEVQRQNLENQGELANSAADIQSKQMEMEIRREELAVEKMRLQLDMLKIQHGHQQLQEKMAEPKVEQQGAGGL